MMSAQVWIACLFTSTAALRDELSFAESRRWREAARVVRWHLMARGAL